MSNQVVYTDQGDIAAMKADLTLLPYSTIDVLAKVSFELLGLCPAVVIIAGALLTDDTMLILMNDPMPCCLSK